VEGNIDAWHGQDEDLSDVVGIGPVGGIGQVSIVLCYVWF